MVSVEEIIPTAKWWKEHFQEYQKSKVSTSSVDCPVEFRVFFLVSYDLWKVPWQLQIICSIINSNKQSGLTSRCVCNLKIRLLSSEQLKLLIPRPVHAWERASLLLVGELWFEVLMSATALSLQCCNNQALSGRRLCGPCACIWHSNPF